jgi:hypothetical protein
MNENNNNLAQLKSYLIKFRFITDNLLQHYFMF